MTDGRVASDGFLHLPGLVATLRSHPAFATDSPGARLFGDDSVGAAAHTPPLLAAVRDVLGPTARPVRTLAFDRTGRSAGTRIAPSSPRVPTRRASTIGRSNAVSSMPNRR